MEKCGMENEILTMGTRRGCGRWHTVTIEKWLGNVFDGNALRMYGGRTPFSAEHRDKWEGLTINVTYKDIYCNPPVTKGAEDAGVFRVHGEVAGSEPIHGDEEDGRVGAVGGEGGGGGGIPDTKPSSSVLMSYCRQAIPMLPIDYSTYNTAMQ